MENGPFNSTLWRDYLRYATLEFSFGGMFKRVTVEETLFGYIEPNLERIKNTPVYEGGVPWMSDVLALIKPSRSHMAFFTGEDDYKLGKVYAEYEGKTYVNQ